METKSFEAIIERLKNIEITEEFDLVVAVARGGTVPGALVAQKLGCPVATIVINFRNDMHQPCRKSPELISPIDFSYIGRRILIVDDRSRTGATLNTAKELLKDAALVRTLAVNGKADYSLFDEPCFKMPWSG
ncbi:MAG TPA: phosphoribosyltransferase [bacterium]|nr:phosphoribosyltransferase [bacterium]HPS29047.1 phosphoribosyltransferase [bacterium]